MADLLMDVQDPDVALMIAFQKGDEAAFGKILDKYQRIIVNFVYRIVNNLGEAEELTQEVFIRVYQCRDRYEPRARFSSWIYRIATNLSLKASRRKRLLPVSLHGSKYRNERSFTAIEQTVQDPGPDAESRLIGSETARILRGAIGLLPKKEKLALILRRYEGLSYKEIALVMDCTEAAVKTYIHRGKLHVRDRILPYLERGMV